MSGENLINTARNGNLIEAKHLPEKSISIDVQDHYGETSLIDASWNDKLKPARCAEMYLC